MTTSIDVIEKKELKLESRYKVLVLNNDVTPFDTVIALLMNVFNKSFDESAELTQEIHDTGYGIAGVYGYEIAYQKQLESVEFLNQIGNPELEVVIEEG